MSHETGHPMPDAPRRYAPALWLVLILFVARVVGQVLVAFAHVTFLPPMAEWYSGLLPYRYLLPAQIALAGLLLKVCLDFQRGHGWFVRPRRGFARFAIPFGAVYLGSMVARYAIRMTLHPEARWFGQTIPIIFHCLLATYVLLFGTFHRRRLAVAGPRAGTARAARAVALLLFALAAAGGTGCRALVSRSVLPKNTRPPAFPVTSTRMTLVTSDGVPLVAQVYRPQGLARTPTLLVRVPFARGWRNEAACDVIGRYWAGRGYTVVLQGTRGRFRSGGEYYPLRDERKDGIETLAWLRAQPWFDGRIGMWGSSGFGYTQWVLADQLEGGTSALILQICSSNSYDMFYPGGAFSLESALYWALRDEGNRDSIPKPAQIERGARGFPLVEADDRAGRDVRVFDDWASHPERDAYWAAIDGEDRAARVAAPALLMAGWYDPFLPAQLRDYERIRAQAGRAAAEVRLVVGPWSHARDPHLPGALRLPPYRRESLSPALGWFDRHLLGRAGEATAPVRIYVMGENVWRDEPAWPLARAVSRSWFLRGHGRANTVGGDGRLEPKPPTASDPADSYTYDPRDPVPSAGGAMIGPRAGAARQEAVERRPDVLVYTSDALAEDLEVTGPVALVLHVATTATNTDFTGKLVDVHPDGATYNVSDGILRHAFTARAAAAAAGPTEIRIELWPTSMLFRKGHRLRLEVSSSNFPRYDRNPNTARAIATEAQPVAARQTVFHGADAPSRLVLAVVPR